jgi:hypothetical protein
MPDYLNSCIYKIFCKDKEIEDIYIGSTTNFTQRKQSHKKNCNNPNNSHYNIKVYQFIRDNGGWSNWDMIIFEEVNCENKLELLKIERKYIEKYNNSLNIAVPSRTNTEYKKDNKDKIKEQSKKYHEANRDKILEKQKKYREANKEKLKEKITCDCGSEVVKSTIQRHKRTKKHQNFIKEI